MLNYKILVEGYARENKDGTWNASPTVVLIESKGMKILIDPGANKKLLLQQLKKEGLKPQDIDIVFLSHYHIDHTLNVRLFPDKPIYDKETIYEDDKETFYEDKIAGTEIEILPTPGHSPEHTSLIFEINNQKYVIAQDVFWWMDGKQKSDSVEDLINLEDPFANDLKALKESRKKVLELADWIIPGHGKMFRNPKKNK